MVNFSSEIGKRQPANKVIGADKVENSLGDTKGEEQMYEERAGVSTPGIVENRKLINPRFWSPSGLQRPSAEVLDLLSLRNTVAGRQGGAGRNTMPR